MLFCKTDESVGVQDEMIKLHGLCVFILYHKEVCASNLKRHCGRKNENVVLLSLPVRQREVLGQEMGGF